MAVEESGRYTKTGRPIYVAAKPKTPPRKQVFAGGKKISDTSRVEVYDSETGGSKWVLPQNVEGRKVITPMPEPPKPTEKPKSDYEKRIETTLERTGFDVRRVSGGITEATREGRKTTIETIRTKDDGLLVWAGAIADTPKEAIIYPSGVALQRKKKVRRQQKEEFLSKIEGMGKTEGLTAQPQEKVKGFIANFSKDYREKEAAFSKLLTKSNFFNTAWLDVKLKESKQKSQAYKDIFEEYKDQPGIKGFLGRTGAKYFGFMEEKIAPVIWKSEKGRREGYRTKPLKTAATYGAFFTLPLVLGGAGAVLSKANVRIFKPVKWAYGLTLPVLYGGAKTKEVLETPKGKRIEKIAEIQATEIEPMVLGGYMGSKFWKMVVGEFRTEGLKEIQPQEIITKDVLTGKAEFPITKQISKEIHYKKFMESKFRLPGSKQELAVYHATPEGLGAKFTTKVGSSELPGLYTSPSLSPYFFKVSGKGRYGFTFELFPSLSPTAAYIYPKGISKLYGSKKTMLSFLTTKAKKGRVYIPGRKSEIEGIIRPDTELIQTDSRYFVKWEGVKIPIKEYKVSGKGISTTKTIKILDLTKGDYSARSRISPLSYNINTYISKLSNSLKNISKPYTTSKGYKGKSFLSRERSSKISSAISSMLSSRLTSSGSKITSRVTKRTTSRISRGSSKLSELLTSELTSITSRPSRISRRGRREYRTTISRPPPSFFTPPRIPFKKGKTEQLKKIKKKKYPTRYRPSLEAHYKGIFGAKPKRMTGLKRRPITPHYARIIKKMIGRAKRRAKL